jgi:acetyl-CoA carboxylase biotin carboxyl carrier protein
MDLRKLKTLVDLVSESNIAELEITESDGKVRIVKATPNVISSPLAATVIPAAPLAMTAGSPMPPRNDVAATSPAVPAGAPARDDGHVVKSPMVGTFYRAATPGAKPLAEIGATVKAGEPLCIIEAMKIMNEIEADVGGVLQRVLVENGQAVEFGQPLFVIERQG